MSDIRICPNCGAGVIGATVFCPRCDFPLEAAPDASAGQADDVQRAILPENAEESEPVEALLPEPPDLAEPQIGEEDTRQRSTDRPHSEDTPAALPAPVPPAEAKTTALPADVVGITAPDFQNAGTRAVPVDKIGITGRGQEPITPQRSLAIMESWRIPPAPYTPPPLINPTTSLIPYSYPPDDFLRQRMQAYRQGGYELRSFAPYQAVLQHGKPLSLGWWLIAFFSGIGLMWYLFLLLSSGFSKDRVFLIIERDGTLYEDGAGAAHTRRRKSRNGQRWGLTGAVIFFVSLIWFVGMVVLGVLGFQRYQAEIEAAYPTIASLLNDESQPANAADLNADDVALMENVVVGYLILFSLAMIAMGSGLALMLVGYLQAAAYRVDVPPLPEYL